MTPFSYGLFLKSFVISFLFFSSLLFLVTPCLIGCSVCCWGVKPIFLKKYFIKNYTLPLTIFLISYLGSNTLILHSNSIWFIWLMLLKNFNLKLHQAASLLEASSIFIHRLEWYDSVIFCNMVKRALHKFLEALHKLTYTVIINLLQISSLILGLGKLLSNYDLNLLWLDLYWV